MTRTTWGRVIVALLVVIGAIALAGAAYQLGLSAAAVPGATAAAPPAVYWYGAWRFGWGFFGLLFPLLFFLLVFALLRAAFWGSPRRWERRLWDDPRARLDEWHREVHRATEADADGIDRTGPDRTDPPRTTPPAGPR